MNEVASNEQYPHIRHNLLSSARNAKQTFKKKKRPNTQAHSTYYVERIDTLYIV